MSELTNGHTNGFGSDHESEEKEPEKPEEDEEECEECLNGGCNCDYAVKNGLTRADWIRAYSEANIPIYKSDSDEESDQNLPTIDGLDSDDDEPDDDASDGINGDISVDVIGDASAQDEDSDSDSAPEDISFKTGKDDFQQKSELQQKQIEKSLTAAREKRRRRDDLLKEQKAAKLAKLKEAKLSTDFLKNLDSTAKVTHTSYLPPSDSTVDPDPKPSSSADALLQSNRRKVFSLPDVEGTEFEVVVEKSDADQEIVKKVNRYIKRHVNPKSLPRQTAKKKQSLASKRRMLKRSR